MGLGFTVRVRVGVGRSSRVGRRARVKIRSGMELWLELRIKIGLRNGVGVKRVKRFRMFEAKSQPRSLFGTGFV